MWVSKPCWNFLFLLVHHYWCWKLCDFTFSSTHKFSFFCAQINSINKVEEEEERMMVLYVCSNSISFSIAIYMREWGYIRKYTICCKVYLVNVILIIFYATFYGRYIFPFSCSLASSRKSLMNTFYPLK